MHFVYVLKSRKDNSLYVGQTSNLPKRIEEHNTGKTRSLKAKIPMCLVYYEAYISKKDATKREWNLKHRGQDREILIKQIDNSNNIMPPSSSG
ncbi:MAG: GIY-YIG nuclease family protein [Proteobacteria bacterium]|nr:GIY-YIG nuclease family protein [Pseudomonadota bacterium]